MTTTRMFFHVFIFEQNLLRVRLDYDKVISDIGDGIQASAIYRNQFGDIIQTYEVYDSSPDSRIALRHVIHGSRIR